MEEPLKHMEFPNSLGLFYSTITAYLGFMVNNDEYKVMGLASYGKPNYQEEFKHLITVRDDGSYSLNQSFYSYRHSKKMWSDKLEELLGDPRSEEEKLSQRHKDIAATLQKILEETLLKQLDYLYSITNTENLCMAGGVALNSVANGRILKESPFENVWIQPASGDDGGAMGAAMERSRQKNFEMEEIYLGPKYSTEEIKQVLNKKNIDYKRFSKKELVDKISSRLKKKDVIGLYQGRMEWVREHLEIGALSLILVQKR